MDIFVHPATFKKFIEALEPFGYEVVLEEDRSYDLMPLNVYSVSRHRSSTFYQIIVPLSRWTECTFKNFVTKKVDGQLFTFTLLRDFDLQICRCAYFKNEYIQRRGGKSVVKEFLQGNREPRVVKYFNRLNRNHFSDLGF